MGYTLIDRRKNGKNKSVVNRQKFIKRVQQKIKKSVDDFIKDKNITDVINNDNKNINIPVGDISEPTFHHKPNSGNNEGVLPGNKKFNPGDTIDKPPSGGGGKGNKASKDGEHEDDFVFTLSKEEFLQFLFEGLELPDMITKELSLVEELKPQRAGFSTDGNPSRLDLLQSMRQSIGRRFALRNPKRKELRELEQELQELNAKSSLTDDENKRKQEVEQRIIVLKRKLKAIPFVDTNDLRYRQFIKEIVPIHKAVMFSVMDVSGSMTEFKKDLAKRFFMLLYLFLERNYEQIDIVFIKHHSEAREVDEQDFFYGKESGGTVVSTALELTRDIIKERYPINQWNIYIAQASDGDNYDDDNELVRDIILNDLMPLIQCYYYIEIQQNNGWDNSTLWPLYEQLQAASRKMQVAQVADVGDIYPVFRNLFQKRNKV